MLRFCLLALLLTIHQSIHQTIASPALEIKYTEQTIYSNDQAQPTSNQLVFPQCSVWLNDGSIAVFHFNVGGRYGQQGVSIFNPSNNQTTTRSISLLSRMPGGPSPPNFITDSFINAFSNSYQCYSMFTINRPIDPSTNLPINRPLQTNEPSVELIAISIPTGSSYDAFNQNLLFTRDGLYVGTWTSADRPLPTFSQLIDGVNVMLTAQYVKDQRAIRLVKASDQSVYQTIDLSRFWAQTDGHISVSNNMVIDQSNPQSINLFFLADALPYSSPTVTQKLIGINLSMFQSFDPVTKQTINRFGQLVTVQETSIMFDSNSQPVRSIGLLSMNPVDQSFIVSYTPLAETAGAVYRYHRLINQQPISPSLRGEVTSIIFPETSSIQGQAVLSDGAIVTTTLAQLTSPVNNMRYTMTSSILIYARNGSVQTINQITGVPQSALNNGASMSINRYFFTCMFADRSDAIYMSNYDLSTDAGFALVPNGILIISRTGQFIDWVISPAFNQLQTPFIDRSGLLGVPDAAGTLFLIDRSISPSRVVREVAIPGVTGVAIDRVNGGYVATTRQFAPTQFTALRFLTSDYSNNASIELIQFEMNSQVFLSNPVTDSDGRIYVLKPRGTTLLLDVYQVNDQSTNQSINQSIDQSNNQYALIYSYNFNLAQGRSGSGLSQSIFGSTLSIDPITQSIVVYSKTSNSFFATSGATQIFTTRPFNESINQSGPSITGDPQFVGLRGQSYQVHGIDGGVYSIISQNDMQLNARFVYLRHGKCPVIDQTVNQSNNQSINLSNKPFCWTHPGTYFGSLGLLTSFGDRVLIDAGSHETGFKSVVVNGVDLVESNNQSNNQPHIHDPSLQIRLIDRFHLHVSVSQWSFDIDNSDHFVNLAHVQVSDWHQLTKVIQPHGLLGQTWMGPNQSINQKNKYNSNPKLVKLTKGQIKAIEGKVDDYLQIAQTDDLFAVQNMFNRFMID